jgi:uncharacterized protein YfkK (UPF0435 family)
MPTDMLSDTWHFVNVDIFDNWHLSGYFGHVYFVIRRSADLTSIFRLIRVPSSFSQSELS